MDLLIHLIKLNLVPLIGISVYCFLVIGLTIVGGKLLQWAGLIKFDAEDSGQTGLAKAIVITGLVIGFTVILAVNTHRSAPTVVMADTIQRAKGGCGSANKGCGGGSEAKKADGQPATLNPCGK